MAALSLRVKLLLFTHFSAVMPAILIPNGYTQGNRSHPLGHTGVHILICGAGADGHERRFPPSVYRKKYLPPSLRQKPDLCASPHNFPPPEGARKQQSGPSCLLRIIKMKRISKNMRIGNLVPSRGLAVLWQSEFITAKKRHVMDQGSGRGILELFLSYDECSIRVVRIINWRSVEKKVRTRNPTPQDGTEGPAYGNSVSLVLSISDFRGSNFERIVFRQ